MSELDLYKRQGFAQSVGIIQDAIDRSVDVLAFTRKAPELLKRTETSPLSQIVDQVRPTPGEPVICKRQASAFFGLRSATGRWPRKRPSCSTWTGNTQT